MVRRHKRSGSWVEGHWRDGFWVEGHYRSGTTVSSHDRDGSDHHPGQLLSFRHECRVTHPTRCWWCDEPVFFYRNDWGGMALFDQLGWPWPIHECWEKYRSLRQTCLNRVADELDARDFDGFMQPKGKAITSPVDDLHLVSLSGFIADNHNGYGNDPRCIRASRSALSIPLMKVVVSDGERLWPFQMSQKKAEDLADYMAVDVEGRWLRRGSRWVLLMNRIRENRFQQRRVPFERSLHVTVDCSYCEQKIGALDWGLDDTGHIECSDCSTMRGKLSRRAFLNRVRKIARKT